MIAKQNVALVKHNHALVITNPNNINYLAIQLNAEGVKFDKFDDYVFDRYIDMLEEQGYDISFRRLRRKHKLYVVLKPDTDKASIYTIEANDYNFKIEPFNNKLQQNQNVDSDSLSK